MDIQVIMEVIQPLIPLFGVLASEIVAIAIFIEVYKKKIKKDKFNPVTIWKIAGVLSVILTVVGYLSFDLPGSWFAIIYYSLMVYALQFMFNMKVIKWIVKMFAKSKGVVMEGFEWDE